MNGAAPIKGMLVYNTNATLGAGLYYWSGDSSKWVKVINSDFTVPLSKIVTAASDSGFFLMSNGSTVVASLPMNGRIYDPGQYNTLTTPVAVTWTKVFDASISINVKPNAAILLYCPGIQSIDLCHLVDAGTLATVHPTTNHIWFVPWDAPTSTSTERIVCFRPSA